MKILLIGGTGTISTAISKLLLAQNHELYLLNRGSKNIFADAQYITCDIHDESAVAQKIASLQFDAVADFVAYTREDVVRDYKLFVEKTKQYFFISSASAYQKPPVDYRVSESTPLVNPFWEYSRNKIACEDFLMEKYRTENFPVTIVRPSHTYNEYKVPVAVHGTYCSWQVLQRMLDGKKIIIPGDGATLWTLTHSSDFARAFVRLIGNPHALGQAVHIVGNESMTWDMIYETIAAALGVKLNAVHIASDFLAKVGTQYSLEGNLLGDKSRTVVFDTTKLKQLVPDFCAHVSMAEGLRASVRYVLQHEECHAEDKAFDTWCDNVIATYENALAQLLNESTSSL